MDFFSAIGMIVCALIAVLICWIAYEIIGNVWGGWKGAVRFWRIKCGREKRPPIKWLIRHALYCWPGRRYNGHAGEYWDLGSMQVPLDGRDRIRRRYYG